MPALSELAARLEAAGTVAKRALNAWLALWALRSGVPALGELRLPQLAAGPDSLEVTNPLSDSAELVTATSAAGYSDQAAAEWASAQLEALNARGAADAWTGPKGIVDLIIAVLSLIGTIVSATASVWTSYQNEDVAEAQAEAEKARAAAQAEIIRAQQEAAAAKAQQERQQLLIVGGVLLGVMVLGGADA